MSRKDKARAEAEKRLRSAYKIMKRFGVHVETRHELGALIARMDERRVDKVVQGLREAKPHLDRMARDIGKEMGFDE